MLRLLRAAAVLLCSCGLYLTAQTPVTGSGARVAGSTIANGFINMWITDDYGKPVPYVNSSGPQKPAAFTAAITNGIIAGGFTVQDLCLASPVNPGVNLSYTVYLYSAGSQNGTVISAVKGVCGTAGFALDTYLAGASVIPAVTGLLSGTTAQTPAICSGTSAYIDKTLGLIKPCINGVFVTPSGTSGGGTGTTNATLFADTAVAGTYWQLSTTNGRLTLSAASSGSGAVNSIPIMDPNTGATHTLSVASGRLIYN